MKMKAISENELRRIIDKSVRNALMESFDPQTGEYIADDFAPYFRRYRKLQGMSKNQDNLDRQKEILKNQYYNSLNDINNPKWDNGLAASNKCTQHYMKQMSVDSFRRQQKHFEKMKQTLSPNNTTCQVPQEYITYYNKWLELEQERNKLKSIYTNEYLRASARTPMVQTKRSIKEFEKLNNFYNAKIKPLDDESMKYFRYLDQWMRHFKQIELQQSNQLYAYQMQSF